MNITLSTQPLETLETGALILLTFDRDLFAESPAWQACNTFTGGLLTELYDSGEFSGKPGESFLLHRPQSLAAQRILLIGAGKKNELTAAALRLLAATALRILKAKQIHHVALALDDASHRADFVQAATEGLLLGDFETDIYKTDPKRASKFISDAVIAVPGAAELESAVHVGRILGEAQNFARSLANEPSNLLTPRVLAARAEQMARAEGLHVDILDEPRLIQLGMGALLGVAQGSHEPPFLIVLKHQPANPTAAPKLAILGKAVTFDTGGISIKPSDGMEQMKYDMCGGAAAIGAMLAIARLNPGLEVTAYIPAVENMPDGRAQRPGDIVKSLSGKTIEILNTDAEGRLILVDAITYAKQQGATHLIDLATLTGAIGVALGTYYTGLFSNHEVFQTLFLRAAKDAGEKMWPMPIDDDYKEQLKSAFADMPNIGSKGAGAITAAMFLKEWAEDTPWIHLDIASTAWINEPKPHLAKGPTGVGVRSLVKLVHALEDGA